MTDGKKSLSEADICAKFITPAVRSAGWDDDTQIRREVHFTRGQIHVRGKMVTRGKSKFADYVLYYKPNIPIAIVEAKDNNHSVGDGMQQALDYAEILNIPFAFSSNGGGFIFHDRTGIAVEVESTLPLTSFPSPARLWSMYREWKGLDEEQEEIVLQDYFDDGSGKEPRYYQLNAINAAIEAIAKGQDRILLVMATGTGKTYTAFQIIWRLWKAGRKKRVLYLADRNVLIDQTMVNDFRPLMERWRSSAPRRIPSKIRAGDGQLRRPSTRKRRIDTSYEIYLSLYQAITGPEERQKLFREFSPGFFDLIVVDECHRGSAAEDAAWREILEYFSSATQIGLTATPKETKYVSNIHYFGHARLLLFAEAGHPGRFSRSLQGHQRPHRCRRRGLSTIAGCTDLKAKRFLTASTTNRTSTERWSSTTARSSSLASQRVPEGERRSLPEDHHLLRGPGTRCADAPSTGQRELRSRQENRRYVMRITGNDKEGQDQLGNFIDPESTFPVLVTTSRLLSTGVDAQTCRLIVLDRPVGSMTEFKQILGRGTRVHEDTGKYYFTLMDFRGATHHFADPDFDGEPVQIYEPDEGPIRSLRPEEGSGAGRGRDRCGPGNDITHPSRRPNSRKDLRQWRRWSTIIAERVKYLDANGKLITERLRDYSKRAVKKRFASLDSFLNRWKAAERKQAIIEELEEEGLRLEPLAEGGQQRPRSVRPNLSRRLWTPPLTRRERAENVRKRDVFTKYGSQARAVLDALLQK